MAKNLSFTRAAAGLRVSQPALTASVRQLEEGLGLALLDRTTRSVRLTAEGERFLPVVERLLGDLDAALADIRALGERRRGRVVVATLPSLAVRLVAPVMRGFLARYPGISLALRDGDASSVVERVRSREVDFGIATAWLDEPELAFAPVLRDRYCVVCPADHALAERATLALGDLVGTPFLAMAAATGIRRQLDREVAKWGTALSVVCEVAQLSTLGGMVEAGLGISVVPELAVPMTVHGKVVTRPLVDPVIERQIGLITRAGRALSPAAESFRDAILAHVGANRADRCRDEGRPQ